MRTRGSFVLYGETQLASWIFKPLARFRMCFPWRKKPLVHRKVLLGDECAICLGVIRNEASTCVACGQSMHRMCLVRWKYRCKKDFKPFTCPLCRCSLE